MIWEEGIQSSHGVLWLSDSCRGGKRGQINRENGLEQIGAKYRAERKLEEKPCLPSG